MNGLRGRGRLGRLGRTVLPCLATALACASGPTRPAPPGSEAVPPVILVSLDGFRADYLARDDLPHLRRLAEEGVRAKALLPVFPTKTFPNHYSMVTGLYPEEHGIVDNHFHDPRREVDFAFDRPEIARDPTWWEAEPIWITAERQGRRTATFFWPGSDVPIRGGHPTHWRPYDAGVPNAERVDQALAWLDLPPPRRPSLIMLYFSDVDSAGHEHGPAAAATARAARGLDRTIGRLTEGLARRGLLETTNLIVVSDHGMAETSPDRVILIDDYLDLGAVHVAAWDPVLALWPRRGRETEVYRRLKDAHPHLSVFLREEIPARLHYRDHRRIPPILGIADPGWSIATRRYYAAHRERFEGGSHGYDDAAPAMHGIFIGHGPGFPRGVVVEPFRNIEVYGLLADLLRIDVDRERSPPSFATGARRTGESVRREDERHVPVAASPRPEQDEEERE